VQGDIGDPATAEQVINQGLEEFGRIDTLVNNAGVFIAKPFTDYTAEEYASIIAVNLTGFFAITQRAVARMLGLLSDPVPVVSFTFGIPGPGVGTVLLRAGESGASPPYKAALADPSRDRTVVHRPAREGAAQRVHRPLHTAGPGRLPRAAPPDQPDGQGGGGLGQSGTDQPVGRHRPPLRHRRARRAHPDPLAGRA
jgi:NAD(P)-dependent dehydrogenase (short-subunit alcohol dehydrogenase family)